MTVRQQTALVRALLASPRPLNPSCGTGETAKMRDQDEPG